MREFLEKRWWQGVGGIAGIIALVFVVLQFLGIVSIPGLALSIALNIILAITLVVVAILAIRWKRKYEGARTLLQKVRESVMKEPQRQRVLLLDENQIWKLNIDNTLLTELYGEAHGRAIAEFHDAKLVRMSILVYPNQKHKVSIHFTFYSPWAERQCSYIVGEIGDMTKSVPDKPGKQEEVTFDELPWLRDPNWLQFLKKAYEKVEPLSPAEWSHYQIWADVSVQPQWGVTFKDGLTGRESSFSWDGKGAPVPGE